MKDPLNDADFHDAATMLGCELAAIKAVAEVESGQYGGFIGDEPVILFERHLFHRLTNGKFDSHSDLSNPKPGGYGKVSEQHAKLARAVELDRDAALQACSWGRFQVLGQNWKSLNYGSLQEFINCMYRSEKDQLDSFVRFVAANGLTKYLIAKDWARFARGYNGKNYSINSYDIKMANSYAKYRK